jgi:cytidine deaminase
MLFHVQQILLGPIEKGKVIGFSEHAERSAIHACRTNFKFEGTIDVWVVRYKESGQLGSSYPCNDCLEFMRGQNVRKISYSTEDGTIKCERLKDMKPQHDSRGFRRIKTGQFW